MSLHPNRLNLVALACLAGVLSACGGGGSASSVESVVAAPGPVALGSVGDSLVDGATAPNVDPGDTAPPAVVEAPQAPAPFPEPEPEPEPPPSAAPTSAPAPVAAPAPESLDPAITLDAGEQILDSGDGRIATLEGQQPMRLAGGGAADFDVDPGRLTVQYQGGDASERSARVTADPVDPSNRAIEFLLQAANVRTDASDPVKGRIQLNAYATESLRAKEVRLRTRMYLGEGFNQLRTWPTTFRWLTLSEWWNDAGWTGQAYPFRITLNITKPLATSGARLYFGVRAETLNLTTNKWDTTVWSGTNTAVPVPVGRWVTLEYHFREGDANEGRFYLAMVPDGGERVVLFDQRGWTHHPDNPAPDGLTHLNPVKLYTAKALIDHARNAGHPLRVHWDDIGFRLCRVRHEPGSSPCGPETFR